jgi:hypothetical protein
MTKLVLSEGHVSPDSPISVQLIKPPHDHKFTACLQCRRSGAHLSTESAFARAWRRIADHLR